MRYSRIDGDHQIQVLDDGGGLSKVGEFGGEIHDRQLRRFGRLFTAFFLKREEANAGDEQRSE